jgi:hypothetical protein
MIFPTLQLPTNIDIFSYHIRIFIANFNRENTSNGVISLKERSIGNLGVRYEILQEDIDSTDQKKLIGEVEIHPISDNRIELASAILSEGIGVNNPTFFNEFFDMVKKKWDASFLNENESSDNNNLLLNMGNRLKEKYGLISISGYEGSWDYMYWNPDLVGFKLKPEEIKPFSEFTENEQETIQAYENELLERLPPLFHHNSIQDENQDNEFEIPDPDDTVKKYGTDRNLTKNQVRDHIRRCRHYQDSGGSVRGYFETLGSEPPFQYETLRSWLKNPNFEPKTPPKSE